jgi:hypothetical protein
MGMVYIRKDRRSSFYIRIHVPADLQLPIGREQISRSLGTSDKAVSQCRAKVADAKATILFHKIRKHPNMSQEQIRRLVAQFIDEELDEWERSVVARGLDNRINGEWQDCLSALSQDRVDELTGELRNGVPSLDPAEFIKRYGVSGVSPGSVEWKLLQRELAKAERTIATKIKAYVQGEYETDGTYPRQYVVKGDGKEARSDVAPYLLSQAIPTYLKHFEHRAPGTIEAKQNVLKRLVEVIGDVDVNSILKPKIVEYRDTLRKFPANISKRYPGLSIREVLDKVRSLRLPESVSCRRIRSIRT